MRFILSSRIERFKTDLNGKTLDFSKWQNIVTNDKIKGTYLVVVS